jgi:hypothetical protein
LADLIAGLHQPFVGVLLLVELLVAPLTGLVGKIDLPSLAHLAGR